MKASKMAVVFGKCGRECLSVPGNTVCDQWLGKGGGGELPRGGSSGYRLFIAKGAPPHTDTLPRGVFKKFPILHRLALPKPCYLASLTSPLHGEIGEHISYFPCL
jgi:hypothetical protein